MKTNDSTFLKREIYINKKPLKKVVNNDNHDIVSDIIIDNYDTCVEYMDTILYATSKISVDNKCHMMEKINIRYGQMNYDKMFDLFTFDEDSNIIGVKNAGLIEELIYQYIYYYGYNSIFNQVSSIIMRYINNNVDKFIGYHKDKLYVNIMKYVYDIAHPHAPEMLYNFIHENSSKSVSVLFDKALDS